MGPHKILVQFEAVCEVCNWQARASDCSIYIYLFSVCLSPGILASSYGIETLAFLSTKPELEKLGWPDLQLHFVGFMPDSKVGNMIGFSEQVCLSLLLPV